MNSDWFCWLSSDDLFVPEKVEKQLTIARQQSAVALFHRYEVLQPGDNFARFSVMPSWSSRAEQQEVLASGCCINGSTVMLHKSVFAKVGLFSTEYQYGQDWEMWCRVGQHFDWVGLPDILATRREHDNLTSQIAAEGGERQRIRDAEDERIRETYGSTPIPAPAPVVLEPSGTNGRDYAI